MSSVVIAGNTSGSVTLNAPDVAGSTIINLPTTTGGSFVVSNASGNVGIGVTSPTERLEVKGNVRTDDPAGGSNHYEFGTDSTGGYLYSSLAIPLQFWTNNAERMRINANGNISLQGGTTNATGVGITFPASQSASSDANCLDDYEEGTFSPTITAASGSVGSYTIQTGRYTKIGNIVFIQLYVAFSKGTLSGNMNVSNLPFALDSSANVYSGCCNVYYSGLATAITCMTGYAQPSSTSFAIRGNTAAATNTDTILTAANFNASSDMIWYLSYRTA